MKQRLLAPLLLALGLFNTNAHAAEQPLKVGTTAAFAIPLEAAVEEAGKKGLKVELVEFTDWIAPGALRPGHHQQRGAVLEKVQKLRRTA